ncbi:MAG: hypothetical protein E7088_04630 [Bacteroidales bacterium]|nr:hypothetical protein [Bacteroidales bacterium]
MDFLDNLNIDTLEPLQDIFPDGWFDDVRQMYGECLSNEMISQSVEETCDFFHIDEPAMVSESWTTGVYPNNDFTLQDDVLIFNREQLLDMGISGKDGLDLVMTHEGTHRVLQGMEHIEFNSHQEELCCDYMAGVRAGLNGIDVSQMENSLMYSPESETHPAGANRVESIEAGVRFAQQYYAEYNMAPTFNECLDDFCEINEIEQDEQIVLRSDDAENEVSFKGYTKSEIDARVSKAEREMSYQKAEIRRHSELAEHDMWRESEISHMKSAERKYEAAKAEYNKWKNMKPDE